MALSEAPSKLYGVKWSGGAGKGGTLGRKGKRADHVHNDPEFRRRKASGHGHGASGGERHVVEILLTSTPLGGRMPAVLACAHLTELHLANCNLKGKLPQFWPTTLLDVDVSNNPDL